jgi:SAM-dependent methyltransferase
MSQACGICGASKTFLWLRRGEWSYYCCDNCSAVWLFPIQDQVTWAETFFDQRYFAGGGRGGYLDYLADEAQHRSNARARIELARRSGVTPPASWLDVGCAVGFTLDEARAQGFKVVGVEPSPWARAIARDRFGLDVFTSIAEARREGPFAMDVVSMFQSLEHMPDPVSAIGDARACLRPGGRLVIETWDRGSLVARFFGNHWQQITPPSVLWLFDRKCLAYLLEGAGLHANAIVRSSKQVSLHWALGILADKAPTFIRPILRAIGNSALGSLSIAYNLGDLVSLVAATTKLV